jgi:hypothetical protein
MSNASIRFVATTRPGFGGTSAPEDVSMENHARLAGTVARNLGCDAVASKTPH